MSNVPFWARVTLLYDTESLVPALITSTLGAVLDEHAAAHNVERSSIRHISVDDFLRQSSNHEAVKLLEPGLQQWAHDSWQYAFLLFLKLARHFELGGITTNTKDRRTLEVVKKDLIELATFANKFGDVTDHPYGHTAMMSEKILKIAGKIREVSKNV